MLIRAAVAVLVVTTMAAVAACRNTSPSATVVQPLEPSIAASWSSDDGSVVAVNIVLPPGIQADGLARLAQRYRDEHPSARVIVRFFSATTGGDPHVIGYVPTDGGPLPDAAPAGALATFDFPASAAHPSDALP